MGFFYGKIMYELDDHGTQTAMADFSLRQDILLYALLHYSNSNMCFLQVCPRDIDVILNLD